MRAVPIKIKIIKTTFLGRSPILHSRSGTHKNLTAAAISINPKLIFKVSIQEPEFGILSNAFGKNDNATNGAANTKPYTIIPYKLVSIPPAVPVAATTRRVPTTGTVQLKLVIENATPSRNAPKYALFEDCPA